MAAINAVTDLTLEGDIAVIILNSPPVNALSAAVRDGLDAAFKAASADAKATAIVLICEGRTFIAGADISEFNRPMSGVTIQNLMDTIESAPKPTVAAIHGTCLGGGLEVAMVCNYRVGVPSSICGMPEVNIGLMPNAGGSQRLPRLVGAEKALEMLTSGEHVPAKKCQEIGLLDELAPEGKLREFAISFARKVVSEKRPLKRVRDMQDKIAAAKGNTELFANFRKAHEKKFRHFKAPENNIKGVEAAVNLPFDQGIAEERKLFAEIYNKEQSRAQQHYFFAEREAWKIPDVPKDTPTRPVNKVGVIGAGTMGGGIAMTFANIGIPVRLVEIKQEALDRGLGVIRRNYERTASRGGITTADVEKRMGLIQGTLAMEDLADCDVVIEAVFERMDIKQEVFKKLDAICKPGAILGSNTSGLNINQIASVTSRPQDVIGLHYFSPANVMKLLEIVRGDATAKDVIATSMKIAKDTGKIAALVGVCQGFVGNRILGARGRQSSALLMEGAMPWQIDKVFQEFGFAMGPYQMSDLSGLDLGWRKENSKGASIRDRLCELDRRGQKTGAGYYDYDENRNPIRSPVAEKVIADFLAEKGVNTREITDQEILERCVYPMINEGAKILEEKIAIRASDIDVIWVNGYNWPVYRGGPMHYADQIGLKNVVAKLKEFEALHGDAFKPAPLLEKLAADGKKFANVIAS